MLASVRDKEIIKTSQTAVSSSRGAWDTKPMVDLSLSLECNNQIFSPTQNYCFSPVVDISFVQNQTF